jgi:3-deoxy-D-manno-octulosonic-acid transferase
LVLLVYEVVLTVAFLLSLPYFIYKGVRTGKYFSFPLERFGRLPRDVNPEGRPAIWVHAVSVGEVLVARPLVQRLRQRFPAQRIVLSTTTATGRELARRLLADHVDAQFSCPLDFRWAVRRTLAVVNPTLMVMVETELWPNLIHAARLRGAHVAVVNGRLSPRSFARYRRVRRLIEPTLREVDRFLMQSEPHAERAIAIGAPAERVQVSGNLKFDGVFESPSAAALERVLAPVAGRTLWVAGSTVAGEEEHVLAALRQVRERVGGTRLLLAPRHPERFDEVQAIIEASGFRSARRSRLGDAPWGEEEILLLDTLGELARSYAFATIVFVGGSLVPRGGHNILEAAVAGKAVIVGPHMENFQEIADGFRSEAALVEVCSGAELGPAVADLLQDDARRDAIGARARALVARHRGALDRTVDVLATLVQ